MSVLNPHHIIEHELAVLGLIAVSKLTFLKIGSTENEFSYVLSFRRQIYLNPNNRFSIPDSLVISHDDTSYRLFLSVEGLNCSKCRSIGHDDSNCKEQEGSPMKSNDTPTTNIERYAEQQGMDIQIQPETNQNQPNITNTELFTNNDRPDQHKQSKAPKRQISQSPEIRENTEDKTNTDPKNNNRRLQFT
ncbi:hypothetical protein HHI36_007757 [Cryptolaemus montrouzieri]|uniref:Uncharacterized protein n=1 Tax=Cryptolaemus montrouzieri TaxID=559131 RepID=A0ABD2MQJ2_9CUCU